MQLQPKFQEIDHRTIKLIVGLIAVSLPVFTSIFAPTALTSISAAYHAGGWSESIFIGFLFAIAAFLFAYNGQSRSEMILSKIAAGAAMLVALFPCECKAQIELATQTCKAPAALIQYVHGIGAVVMFVVLAYFCYLFRKRARSKGHTEANRRALIYLICGAAIVLSMLVMAYDRLSGNSITASIPRLTFFGEATALIAFGISWFTASRFAPLISSPEERATRGLDRELPSGGAVSS